MPALLRVILGRDPREPLLGRASVASLVALLVAFGVKLTPGQADALVDALVFILPAAVAAYTAFAARGKVTPVEDPRTEDGTALVPADGLGG